MKRFTVMNWKPLLVLAFLAFPSAPVTGQTEVQLREIQERQAQEKLTQVQERLVQVRERQGDIQQVVVRARARVRLGVTLDASQGEEFDNQGALLKDVIEDSPAEDAGLMVGDIITHINGQSLTGSIPDEGDEEFDEDTSLPVQRLMALASDLEDGEEVEVRYIRDGASASVTLEASEMGDNWFSVGLGNSWVSVYPEGEEGSRAIWFGRGDGDGIGVGMLPQWEGLRGELDELHIELDDMDLGEGKSWTLRTRPNARFFGPENNMVFRGDNDFSFGFMSGTHGLELRELHPDLGAYFSTDRGVLVIEVDEDSALGLKAGDVILSIGDREVEDTRDVFRILGSYEDREAITFTIMRHGQERQVEGTTGR